MSVSYQSERKRWMSKCLISYFCAFLVEDEEYLVGKLSYVWGLLCEHRSWSLLSAPLQQTQDGVQAAPWASQHTCNTQMHHQLKDNTLDIWSLFHSNQNPTNIAEITTANKMNMPTAKAGVWPGSWRLVDDTGFLTSYPKRYRARLGVFSSKDVMSRFRIWIWVSCRILATFFCGSESDCLGVMK